MIAKIQLERPDGAAHIVSTVTARGPGTSLSVKAGIDVRWNGKAHYERRWTYEG